MLGAGKVGVEVGKGVGVAVGGKCVAVGGIGVVEGGGGVRAISAILVKVATAALPASRVCSTCMVLAASV